MTRSERERAAVVGVFGLHLVLLAESTDPSTLNLTAELMDRVHDCADALLILAKQPERQRDYVDALPDETKLVLCMWLIGAGLAAKLVRRAAMCADSCQ